MLATRDALGATTAVSGTEGIGEPSEGDRFTARGARAVARLRHAVREGNVLNVSIADRDGRPLLEVPLLLGVRGGRGMKPVWAAVRALAAASEDLTFEIDREPAWPRPSDADRAAREGSGEE